MGLGDESAIPAYYKRLKTSWYLFKNYSRRKLKLFKKKHG